jgi:hypothetical protein
MRTSPRARVVPLAFAAVLLLGGCTAADPQPTASPAPSSTPIFATDEEALAAAEAAYAEYLAVSDQILADGGAEPERLLTVATQDVYEYEKQGFDQAQQQKLRGTGKSTFDSARLQSHDADGEPAAVIYVCEDISGVDVLDELGNSVVPADRLSRYALTVAVSEKSASSSQFLVSAVDEWEGDNFCV